MNFVSIETRDEKYLFNLETISCIQHSKTHGSTRVYGSNFNNYIELNDINKEAFEFLRGMTEGD